MKNVLNRKLISIVAIGWLSLLISGLVLTYVLATPAITIIIDRSYCSADQWQTQVATSYRNLYQKYKDKQLKIESVILFSDLSQESSKTIPTPEEIANLNTYGQLTADRQKALENLSKTGQVLRCQ